MSTMLIAFNGTRDMGQYLGDTLVSVKAAWLFARNVPCEKYLLALSPRGDLNFLWDKFIRTYNCQVVYDTFHPGNMDQRFASWDKWRKDRKIDGIPFDIYRELYRRIDGGNRQGRLCGSEKGLGRKNIFEYFYYGQEDVSETCPGGDSFGDDLIDHPVPVPERDVLIAPYAKCQGNGVFTFQFWDKVVRRLVELGVTVTVNHNGDFCNDLVAGGLYRKMFPDMKGLRDEVCRHRLVCCGNTGVGWIGAACGTPLLAMQPVDSNMQDYRYEWCGVRSLVEYLETPDADYCVKRVCEEVEKVLVLTTGCFDILHSGHVRHLEESRALGTRLVVALNSDASVRKLKGGDRPYHKQGERETVLRALRSVDDVQIFDGDNAIDLIKSLRPMVITNGCDHKVEEIVGKDFVEQYGGRVAVTAGTRTTSTTATVAKVVKAFDVIQAVRNAQHLSPNPFHKLKLMADEFLSVKDIGGDVADVGAYRGACSLIFKTLAPGKVIHLFDTWSGNPHEDPLCHHKRGEWAASLDEVKKVVGQGENVAYYQGVFPESAKGLEEKTFSFVMIDPDTYPSVRDAIAWFWPRMVKGGKMFFDDYGWEPCAGVKKAVDEVFTEEQRKVYAGSYSCVITK